MRIRRVTIENFKRFERLEVELRPFDCLVGPNNSGKTTLLQALALFDFCVHECVSATNGTFKTKPRTVAPEEFYVLPVAEPTDLWTDRKTRSRNDPKKIAIQAEFDDAGVVKATVDLNFNRFGLNVETSGGADLQALKTLRISYLPVFSSLLPREERRTPAVIADELARGRVHGVIRNLLLDLKTQGRARDLDEVLRRLFPDLVGLSITFDQANDRYISVTYGEKGRTKQLDIFAAGSGFQQFVYLFGFILLREPTIVLLDEPDVHLHGSLQHALLHELRDLVARGKQVAFATHSRDLISHMSPEEILSIEETGQARRLAVAFDVYDTLDQLGSVDPTQIATLQAYRRVVVVEDRTDEDLLSTLCTIVLGAQLWQQIERRIAFCYAKGNPWKSDMSKLRDQLQQMIATRGTALRMFVVADRDYHPDRPALLASLESQNIEWHVWERTEIENYLLCAEAITRIVAPRPQQQVTLGEAAVRREMEDLVERSRPTANDRLVKAFQELHRRAQRHADVSDLSREARHYLDARWPSDRLALADAKDIVLPGLKRWLQNAGYGQFSDKALAEALQPAELPQEVHQVARRMASFAGL